MRVLRLYLGVGAPSAGTEMRTVKNDVHTPAASARAARSVSLFGSPWWVPNRNELAATGEPVSGCSHVTHSSTSVASFLFERNGVLTPSPPLMPPATGGDRRRGCLSKNVVFTGWLLPRTHGATRRPKRGRGQQAQ